MVETVKDNCYHLDCRYRTTFDNQPCCGYMLITNEPRRSSISACGRYEPGKIKVISVLGGMWYDR